MQNFYNQLDQDQKNRLSQVKFMVFDFDGVFTDNNVWQTSDGTETIQRSRYDSQGFDLLEDVGLIDRESKQDTEIKLLILSRETNPVVASTAKKLKIDCSQSIYKKPEALKEETEKRGYKKEEVLFMGNDLNDLFCFDLVGLTVAPADADERVKDRADLVTNLPGGRGAIRELCEYILFAKKKHPLQ